jgi:predicted ATPase
VNRAARIMRTAAESQVLVSSTTADTVTDVGGVPDLVDLGERRLRGLRQPQRLFDLLYAGHPPTIAAGPGLASNLPSPLIRLVGRETEHALLLELLEEHRLVTLVGAGGIGKTSLAEAAAVGIASRFSGGTWFIALAALGSGDAVPSAFAAALGVQPRRDASVTDSIVASYRDQRALVVVDNCEHVIDEVALVVEAMLRGCPHLTVLATSREPLALRGERRVDLLSLAVPGVSDTPAEIAAAASVQLLCERAAEAGRQLSLDRDDAPVVGDLCRLLGGIPLAIELAASQLRVLRPVDALERLRAGIEILRDERRDAPDRHRTLHATMDWSYQLLGPDEQRLFDRLAIFLGGFTLDAADAVCSGEGVDASDVAELLWRLVDRSMVHIDDHSGASRYAVLEPLRQHALGHLDPSEQSRLAGRHLIYFRDVAESSTIGIRGSDEAAWVDRLNADFQNLRAAARHGVSSSRLDDAARLVAALHDYAIWRQRFEVGDWACAVLDLAGAEHHPAASVLFATAGWGRCIAGEFDRAIDLANRGLEAERRTSRECGWLHDVLGHAQFFQANNNAGLDHSHAEIDRARTSGDRYRLAYVLADNAMHEYMVGNVEAARTGADEALALAEAQECPSLIGVAHAARSMAQLDVNPDEARAAARKAARAAGTVEADWTKNVVTTWLVLLAVDRTDRTSDLVLAREAIDSYRRAGDEVRARTVAHNCLPVLAAVLAPDGTDDLAQLHGASLDRPIMKAAFMDEYLNPAIANLESMLGSTAFAAAVERGRELTTSQAAELTINLLDRAVANAVADGET